MGKYETIIHNAGPIMAKLVRELLANIDVRTISLNEFIRPIVQVHAKKLISMPPDKDQSDWYFQRTLKFASQFNINLYRPNPITLETSVMNSRQRALILASCSAIDFGIHDFSKAMSNGKYNNMDELIADGFDENSGDKNKYPFGIAVENAEMETALVHETVQDIIMIITSNFIVRGIQNPVGRALEFLAQRPTFTASPYSKKIQTNLELFAKLSGTGAIGNIAEDEIIPDIVSIVENGDYVIHPNAFDFFMAVSKETIGGCPVVNHTGLEGEDEDSSEDHIITLMIKKVIECYQHLVASQGDLE